MPAPPTHKAELRLLFLGRLSREKGIELLLDALSRYSNPFQLTVLGLDGPLMRQVNQRAHRDHRIRLHPPVPHGEVDRLLAAHDVVCCLSLWDDPLPGSVIEARLHGKAILATDKGGIPEILAGYGKCVILKTHGLNRAQLVEACLSALPKVIQIADVDPDPSEEAAFVQRFSPSHFADQFEALYTQGPHNQSVVLPLQT